MSVSPEVGNFNIFANCKKESVETIYANPIPTNKVEISFFQNLLDNIGMPNDLYFDLTRVNDLKDALHIPESAHDTLNEYLPLLEGTKFRFVKDPQILAQLDLSSKKIQTPYIKNTTLFSEPIRNRDTTPLMDKIEFNQNMFLEISDEKSDLTIIPVEVNWDFLAKLRQGFSMKYGATWEMKAEYLSNSITIKECQTVKKEFSMNYDASKVIAGG